MNTNKLLAQAGRKRAFLFTVFLAVLFLAAGAGVFQFFLKNIREIDHDTQRTTVIQSAQLIQKEFDLLEQRTDLLLHFVEGHDSTFVDHYLAQDSTLSGILVFCKEHSTPRGHKSASNLRAFLIPLRTMDLKDGRYQIWADVWALNNYFKNLNATRTYFELFSADRHYVLSPDSVRVGQLLDARSFPNPTTSDTVVLSSYLMMDVLQQRFEIDSFMKGSFAVVSVPVLQPEDWGKNIIYLSFTLTGTSLLLMLIVLFNLYRSWQRKQAAALALAHRNREQTEMRLNQLREQLNPHFLFNVLGSLQQLIGEDQDHAKVFVGQLAKVYRQVLQADKSPLANVRDELNLSKSYLFLQKVRFGESISSVDIQVSEAQHAWRIPRMSLQILTENAIKHNALTVEHPLRLSIYVEGHRLVVGNTRRPRTVYPKNKSGYGLHYLRAMYTHLGQEGFDIEVTDAYFKVYLPLLT